MIGPYTLFPLSGWVALWDRYYLSPIRYNVVLNELINQPPFLQTEKNLHMKGWGVNTLINLYKSFSLAGIESHLDSSYEIDKK